MNMDKISYALGLSIGNNFKTSGINELNTETFTKALNAVLKGEELEMDYEEAQNLLNDFFGKLQNERLQINKLAGEEFLTINKNKAGIITLPSGLQYQVLKVGEGKTPVASDTVKVHYEGTLIDGHVFDSSIKRGTPATFGVTQVIKGWTEALQLMPVGSKWKLFIPSELAYGEQGAGNSIEPNSTLIFEVELIDIV